MSLGTGGIGEWIMRRAHRRPEARALVEAETGRALSYAELDTCTTDAANGLAELGVRRGDRVALLAENSVEYLVLLFAISKLGAIAVPINIRLAASEIAYLLGDSGANVLAVSDRFAELGSAALAAADHRVTHTVLLGSEHTTVVDLTADELLARGADGRHAPSDVGGGDVCVIMYTSGTTGRPKGAMLTHDNMLWNAINMMSAGGGLSGQDTTISVAPLFHIGALGLSALPVLYAGGTVVVQRDFDPGQTLDLMRHHAVTTQFLVPAMWAAITKVDDRSRFDVPSLRWVLSGGAPCPLPVIEHFAELGWPFMEGFGMTELSPAALFLDQEYVVSHAGSVGRPFMHVDARLVDDDGRTVPTGTVGELVLRGPTVFAGYWGNPVATAEALRDGWFHSGDLGVADTDGFITLVDRKKDMIISGGENVYPIEVEQVLHQHPAVDDVAVVGVPDDTWGEAVFAAVVVSTEVSADEIIDFARERLAHFKCPRRVTFTDELPRNATGKLLKRVLRERYSGHGAAVTR